MPPVDPEISSGHEAAGIAEQENSGTSVLVWVAQPLEHVGVGPSRLPFGERFEETSGHGCDDVSRRDSVDPDAVLTPLGGKVSSQLQDGGLGGVVGTALVSWVILCTAMRRGKKVYLRANQSSVCNSAAHAPN